MTFIDWSDDEGMFGLLVDFVADERSACVRDAARRTFLAGLLHELGAIEARLQEVPAASTIAALKDVVDGLAAEFARDPVVVHLEDCIEELERIHGKGGA